MNDCLKTGFLKIGSAVKDGNEKGSLGKKTGNKVNWLVGGAIEVTGRAIDRWE